MTDKEIEEIARKQCREVGAVYESHRLDTTGVLHVKGNFPKHSPGERPYDGKWEFEGEE